MSRDIKLLHTEWSDGWGGQEIRILSESKAFVKKGYSVMIAAQPDSQLIHNAKKASIPTLPVKMNKGLNLLAIIKLFIFLKKNSIDIIHTHSSVDSRTAGIAGKLAGVKVVRSRHISVPVSKSKLTWFQYMVLTDKLITSGESIKQTLVKDNRMLPEHIVSAPAGVDEESFSSNVKGIDRALFNLNSDNFVVGMVSVLRSWKGHEFVIRAMPDLIRDIPSIHLLILGDGPIKRDIVNLISELSLEKYITLAGHQTNPAPFYQEMDVVILPSYAGEATSQTLPQAMLMQKPVVSTNIGGLSEVVVDRETGLVVFPKDSDSIYKAIFELFSDTRLRKRLAENGRAHALNNFTFSKMIETTEGVYLSLLK